VQICSTEKKKKYHKREGKVRIKVKRMTSRKAPEMQKGEVVQGIRTALETEQKKGVATQDERTKKRERGEEGKENGVR